MGEGRSQARNLPTCSMSMEGGGSVPESQGRTLEFRASLQNCVPGAPLLPAPHRFPKPTGFISLAIGQLCNGKADSCTGAGPPLMQVIPCGEVARSRDSPQASSRSVPSHPALGLCPYISPLSPGSLVGSCSRPLRRAQSGLSKAERHVGGEPQNLQSPGSAVDR